MRKLRYKTVVGLIMLALFNTSQADKLIYGFNKVTVNQDLKTSVELDQSDFKDFKATDSLKLRVKDGKNVIREDSILNNNGVWEWNKILPFSENLKFLILKDSKPISKEYLADTKSALQFSEDKQGLPFIKGIHYLPAIPIAQNNEKKRLPIDAKALKDCKDKVLVVVFDKATNTLLWNHYGELKSSTDEIELSKNMQPTIAVVTDDGSCGK